MHATATSEFRLTQDEYLVRERLAASKSEYVDGIVYAMAGGSSKHALIQTNITATVWNGIGERGCLTYSSEMKIWAPAAKAYFYPDLSVVCDVPKYREGTQQDALENPTLLLEVLSPSTANYDRTRKFSMYRSIPSLRQYVLVAQDEPRVEIFTKDPQGFWIFTDYTDLEAIADFNAIDITVPLAAIYKRIEFDEFPA